MATTHSTVTRELADHPTAPLPPAAVEALARLELAFASPVERLRKQIVRLEDSLRIQREGRDADLALLRDTALPELERAAAVTTFRTTSWEIVRLQGQLREYRAELAVATRYQSAAEHCRSLAESADFDGCLAAQDEMAMCRCQLERAGRLDLIGAS